MNLFKHILNKLVVLASMLLILVGCEHNQSKTSTATNNVEVLSQEFEMFGLDRLRKIRVYLPPNYSSSEKSFPVLYMHDGQNLFDDKTSYVGEWGVDEALNQLHNQNKLSLIVVGVDNGQAQRMNELSPWQNNKYGVAEGEQYMQFIVEQVKPYIDSHYRTLADQQNTAIMGSSMGGLISHYAILKYPNTFSKAGIFSPSFWYSEQVYKFTEQNAPDEKARLFYLMGGNEGSDSVANMEKMVHQIKRQGHSADRVFSDVVAGGEHNEQFWRANFERAVLWLFEVESL
jgi:predicted alpha/beta superfamily hydrolase